MQPTISFGKSKESPLSRKIRNYGTPLLLDLLAIGAVINTAETHELIPAMALILILIQSAGSTANTFLQSMPYSSRNQ